MIESQISPEQLASYPPTTEVALGHTTTEQLRRWAANLESLNPIGVGDTDEDPVISLDWTDSPFMGIELTFRSDAEPVHRLVILADQPTAVEAEEMEATLPERYRAHETHDTASVEGWVEG